MVTINSGVLMHVVYKTKAGKRDEFIQKVKQYGIITASRLEPGNLLYEYYYPIDDVNSVFLVELWKNAEAKALHGCTEHFGKLTVLKKQYVEEVHIKEFSTSDFDS